MEIRQQPFRLSEHGRRRFDVVLAVCLVLPGVLFAGTGISWTHGLLNAAETVPLLWRRRYPVAAFAAVAAASALQVVVTDVPVYGQVAFPVALYSVVRFSGRGWGLAATGVGLLGAVVASVDWMRAAPGQASLTAYTSVAVSIATIVVATWAIAALTRTRQAYVDALVAHNAQLRRDSEQRAALAAADERARIAREMHDVVAHGLSVIVVQADGARYAVDGDPAAANRALGTISETARQSLTEMRRMLGLLRAGGPSATRPQPTLADLGDLVEESRRAGLPVTAELPDPGARVPDGVALTAYRVVQEALSNVRRHAGPGAAATVRVQVDDAGVAVEVTDDGRGAASADDGRGLGLTGMRERVAVHEGELETGPLVGGGFRVAARLPL